MSDNDEFEEREEGGEGMEGEDFDALAHLPPDHVYTIY